MIKLFQFPPALGLPNASPFCMKVETYLRMAALPFECPRGADLRKAPKGKFPYIEDRGRIIADSSFIIDYLKSTYGDLLDGWLDPGQRSVALAFQRLLEENTYWAVLYTRWVEAAGWRLTKSAFFDPLGVPLKWIVAPVARRAMCRELHGHGMGRHSREEIYSIGKRDIAAVAVYLGDKPFFMGAQPSTIDATVYAFVANVIMTPLEHELRYHATQYSNLVEYCARMKGAYFAKEPVGLSFA